MLTDVAQWVLQRPVWLAQAGLLDERHDLGDPLPHLVVVIDPGQDDAVEAGLGQRDQLVDDLRRRSDYPPQPAASRNFMRSYVSGGMFGSLRPCSAMMVSTAPKSPFS
jgi:hypothetical protein